MGKFLPYLFYECFQVLRDGVSGFQIYFQQKMSQEQLHPSPPRPTHNQHNSPQSQRGPISIKGALKDEKTRHSTSKICILDQNCSSINQDVGMGGEQWSSQEETRLIQLHNKYGNRWVQIGQILNRTDNTIKNHYYSRLRRGLRILNRHISLHFKNQWPQLNQNVVSKIVQAAQQLYRADPQHPQQTSNAYSRPDVELGIKNKLLEYGKPQPLTWPLEEYKQAIQELVLFNRNYRKRRRTSRRTDTSNGSEFKAKEMKTLIEQNRLQKATVQGRLRKQKGKRLCQKKASRGTRNSVKIEEEESHEERPARRLFAEKSDNLGTVKQEQVANEAAYSRSLPVFRPHQVGGDQIRGWSYPFHPYCMSSPYLHHLVYPSRLPSAERGGESEALALGSLRGQTTSSIPNG